MTIKATLKEILFHHKELYRIYQDFLEMGYKVKVRTFLGRIRSITIEAKQN